MWELDCKESWVPKNWCFSTVVLEKTLDSPLDYKEIKPVNPKGNPSWIFIGRIDAEAEAPILWPPDAKNWLTGKDPDVGKAGKTHIKGQVQFSSVSQSCPTLCVPMDYSSQASLSITNSWSLLKLMSVESLMPPNHLILCHPLLLLPSIFPNITVFFNESALHNRWPKYWSFTFNISPSNEYSGWISFTMDWLDLLTV